MAALFNIYVLPVLIHVSSMTTVLKLDKVYVRDRGKFKLDRSLKIHQIRTWAPSYQFQCSHKVWSKSNENCSLYHTHNVNVDGPTDRPTDQQTAGPTDRGNLNIRPNFIWAYKNCSFYSSHNQILMRHLEVKGDNSKTVHRKLSNSNLTAVLSIPMLTQSFIKIQWKLWSLLQTQQKLRQGQ